MMSGSRFEYLYLLRNLQITSQFLYHPDLPYSCPSTLVPFSIIPCCFLLQPCMYMTDCHRWCRWQLPGQGQGPVSPERSSFLFLQCTAAAKSLQLCPTLCDPMDGSPPDSPVPGILQARTLEWVAISFSNAWKWKVKVKSLSRARLLVTPWTAAYQAPPSSARLSPKVTLWEEGWINWQD